MRRIAMVSVGRSDWGIYQPVAAAIRDDAELSLHLIVAGAHLSPEFGLTVRQVEADGFEVGDRVEMLLSSDAPLGVAKSMGLGTIGFAEVFSRNSPDILLVLGDRFEMHSAVVGAVPFNVPVAHIHGGELTEGAIDEQFRHSITKMSHLHFAATEQYAQRIVQMGEEPWRVTVTGAPCLDNLNRTDFPDRQELERDLDLDLSAPPLLVTYHPATIDHRRSVKGLDALLAALGSGGTAPILFTYSNPDAQSREIIGRIREFVAAHSRAKVVPNLGQRAYFSLMRLAAAMVGNSSSGIVEAASFQLPVVNIGNRQGGRIRAGNVIDVEEKPEAIAAAIRRAVSPDFRAQLQGLQNPYGDGHASERIVKRLKEVEVGRHLLCKRFQDYPVSMPTRF